MIFLTYFKGKITKMLFLSSTEGIIKTIEIKGIIYGRINKIVYCLDTLQIKGLIKPPNKFISVSKCKSEIIEKCKNLGVSFIKTDIKKRNFSNEMRVVCPNDVISGSSITKDKRHELFGKVAGGSGSRNPEDFQRSKIIEGTGFECNKTNVRINLRKNTLNEISHPNKNNDGFDYSEDFDGVQCVNNKKIYINLKCIVGKGGAQTRSLREVYWFIEGQLNILKNVNDVYFVNILDGDEAHSCMSKFEYILELPEFSSVKQNISIPVYIFL